MSDSLENRPGPKPEDLNLRLDSLINLHRETEKHALSFCYRGPFLDRFTSTILDIYEGTFNSNQGRPMVSRKVSFLLVECFQNILRHGESGMGTDDEIKDDGLFSFRSTGDEFIINSINLVQKDEAAQLAGLMNNINSMDGERLKELYLKQLNISSISAKGGAGLGLIELARKSGREVLYEFTDAPGGKTLFNQQVTFSLLARDNPVRNMIFETRKMYERMIRENTILYYKGDFSQKAILPLLDIVEHNVASEFRMSTMERKTGHVLIEILQNIARHARKIGERPEGIFTIGWNNGRILLQTGNMVNDEEKDFLNEKLHYLSALSREELNDLHRTALRASLKFENKHKSGLGLIEIARASCEPLHFRFRQAENHHHHLFTLQVAI